MSAESVTAASAVVAALVALAVGIWENAQERQHHRLSVLPALEYVVELRDAEEGGGMRGIIRTVNEGVGPAVIDRIRLRVRDASGVEREYTSWGEAAPALGPPGVEITGRAEIADGSVVGIGRMRELVTLRFTESDAPADTMERFGRLLERLIITTEYHSVNGDEYVTSLDG